MGVRVPSWSHHGKCFKDYWARILKGSSTEDSSLTTEKCLEFCSTKGYAFYGVNGIECFCDSDAPSDDPRPDSDCTSVCGGDSTQICGGYWRINIYSVQP